jgi:hypothetical protein
VTSLSFDFGRNWEAFSNAKVDAERLHYARRSLCQLTGTENIRDGDILARTGQTP